jgi:hypothetical protein
MRAEEQVISWVELEKMLKLLEIATKNDDFEQVRALLKLAVSGFVPQCKIGDLLWKQDNKANDITS